MKYVLYCVDHVCVWWLIAGYFVFFLKLWKVIIDLQGLSGFDVRYANGIIIVLHHRFLHEVMEQRYWQTTSKSRLNQHVQTNDDDSSDDDDGDKNLNYSLLDYYRLAAQLIINNLLTANWYAAACCSLRFLYILLPHSCSAPFVFTTNQDLHKKRKLIILNILALWIHETRLVLERKKKNE